MSLLVDECVHVRVCVCVMDFEHNLCCALVRREFYGIAY